jgi:hypothetical protein
MSAIARHAIVAIGACAQPGYCVGTWSMRIFAIDLHQGKACLRA